MITRKWLLVALMTTLFTPFCVAAQRPPDEKGTRQEEEAKLQGAWRLIQWKTDGENKPVTNNLDQAVQMIFTGNKFQMKFDAKVYDEGTISINHAAMPKAIDVTHVGERFRGQVGLGIYEFKNKSELWMAIGRAGDAKRPANFDSEKGTDHAVYVFRR
jgi:uncharacterized protein (TIGR03067 family)